MVIVIILLAIMFIGYGVLFISWHRLSKAVTRYLDIMNEVGEQIDAMDKDLDELMTELDNLDSNM